MRFGILTSGGDCPGLNATIRAIVLKGSKHYNAEFVGFIDGWRGLIENEYVQLTRSKVRGLNKQGGTILGTSRVSVYRDKNGPEIAKNVVKKLNINGIIAIGGEGTIAGAARLANDTGINILCAPKTIDNDIAAGDYTFGFDTAVNIATEAMNRLRTTGESHHRCMVVEVMGRHAGWIALHAGTAVGAHAILIPEEKVSIEKICNWVKSVYNRKRAPFIVVAEGFMLKNQKTAFSDKGLDGFNRPRLGGIADILAPIIEKKTGIESRATVLGHIQRGGAPTAFDCTLATRIGLGAIDAAMAGKWNHIMILKGTDISSAHFSDVVGKLKTVPIHRYKEISILFG